MLRCSTSPRPQLGYTLVELVTVIVLLGFVGIFTFRYLGFGAQIYSDTTGREQLISQSRFAVERLSLELRNALPRSIRVDDSDNQRCIEFLPVITSSNYLQIPRPGLTANDDFIVVEPIRSDQLEGRYLFVYATSTQFIYGPSNLRRKEIDTVDLDTPQSGLLTINYNTTPSFFPTESPARRYYVTGNPVSWCYNEAQNRLERYSDYGLSQNQNTHAELLSSATYEVMAVNLVNDTSQTDERPFRVFEPTLQRNNLVQIDWRFQRGSSNEPLQILHEVHAPNVP
ncbi:MAG: hypothetical protein LAT77_04875 [Aliidiomarina sp.]|uniref:PilW family protein n=1 Tax=Aliidiomarina sp. TaxID=1872439 RepID=UPI0025C01A5E|nr:hypothetical protein [Aliidiomarina sp.]MCH8501231.1 hypothetical protein [Aliidiomarina sp.]